MENRDQLRVWFRKYLHGFSGDNHWHFVRLANGDDCAYLYTLLNRYTFVVTEDSFSCEWVERRERPGQMFKGSLELVRGPFTETTFTKALGAILSRELEYVGVRDVGYEDERGQAEEGVKMPAVCKPSKFNEGEPMLWATNPYPAFEWN